MKALKNQAGFTLVEMLVVAGVISIVALAFSNYILQATKQQKHVEDNMEFVMLNNQLNSATLDPQSLYNSGTFVTSTEEKTFKDYEDAGFQYRQGVEPWEMSRPSMVERNW